MSNILGKPFEDFVKKQIEVRQKTLGLQGDQADKKLQDYLVSTPFLRLASSVNITDLGKDSVYQKLTKTFDRNIISEDGLAKKFILQGGVVDSNQPNDPLQYGLNNGVSQLNGAYGWGGIEERGYVPMPGITQADVTYYNNGALSKTVINVKCFSIRQFQLFDALYLRPGYTLLLEFGHSQYLNNEGQRVSFDQFSTIPMLNFLNGGVDQYEMYKKIEETRITSDGNYEAIFGKISNFNWQFNPDGSYDCQIQLTAIGDVIESLKTNIVSTKNFESQINQEVLLPTSLPTNPLGSDREILTVEGDSTSITDPTPSTTKTPIVSNKDKTIINQKLYSIFQSIKSPSNSFGFHPLLISSFKDDKSATPIPKIYNNGLFYIQGPKLDTDTTSTLQAYIKYGAFLAFVQSELLLYSSKNKPYFTFDVNFDNLEEDENYILSVPGQLSSDPKVCLIPFTNYNILSPSGETMGFLQDITDSDEIFKINEKLSNESGFKTDNVYLSRISNLMVNLNYIATVLESFPKDEDGNIKLLDFLKEINKGIIEATGNINKYDFKLSQSGLKVQIIEEIPQRFNTSLFDDSDYAKFNIFGVQQQGIGGSFIRNINLTADLSNDFATMVSIGTQANSNQNNANATSFSNYNLGLVDRIIPERVSSDDLRSNAPGESKKLTQLSELLDKEKGSFLSLYGALSFNINDANSLKENQKTALSIAHGILTNNSSTTQPQLQAPFFLPFNLQLTMDGLSGMVLYQRFKITEDILPPSYEDDSVDIIIKGINHSISPSGWTTKLDTLSVPSFKLGKINNPISSPASNTTTTVSTIDQNFNPIDTSIPITNILLEPPPISPESIALNERDAMLKAYDGVFNRDNEAQSMCARWVYNLALNYKSFSSLGSLQPLETRKGNANQPVYWGNLNSLGWSSFPVVNGSNLTKKSLTQWFSRNTWDYGDIVVYWSNNGDPEANYFKHGHTQIYVGDINNIGWASSKKLNHGGNFVYRSVGKDNWSWNVKVFKYTGIK